MGNQSDDPRRSAQQSNTIQQGGNVQDRGQQNAGGQKQKAGSGKSPKVGQPGEQDRTSQQNAGSTEGGGTRNADNSVERVTEDGGVGREQRASGRTAQGGDDLDGNDIDRPGAQGSDENEAPGSRPR